MIYTYNRTVSFTTSGQGACFITGYVVTDDPFTAQLSTSTPGRFDIGQQVISPNANTTYGHTKFNGNQVSVEFGGYVSGSPYITTFTGSR